MTAGSAPPAGTGINASTRSIVGASIDVSCLGVVGNVRNCRIANPEAVAVLTRERLLAEPGMKDIGLTLPMQRVINARFALRSREQGLIVSSSFDGLYRV